MRKMVGQRRLPDPQKELGCGYFGCVYATSDKRVVVKLTTDPTESAFWAATMMSHQVGGLVFAYNIGQLGNLKHKKRPVIAVWREAASRVGLDLEDKSTKSFVELLGEFAAFADMAKNNILELEWDNQAWTKAISVMHEEFSGRQLASLLRKEPPDDVGVRVGILLAKCHEIADRMSDDPDGRYVGDGLLWALYSGWLLSDVHPGNVGQVVRDGRRVWVITDPGLAIPLFSGHLVEIPVLEVDRD